MTSLTCTVPRSSVFRALASHRGLWRVAGGYALFTLAEYSVWIAMLVYAYGRGGAPVAGAVALAQLVPAAVLAPAFASVADRRSPVVLLAGGYLMQAAGMAATAVAIAAGVPMAAYAAAVVAATAVTATRPAQSTVIPSLAATPDQLTAANVVVSWVEAAGIAAAGLLTGVLMASGGLACVFGVCAAFGVIAAVLVLRLRAPALAGPQHDVLPVATGLGTGVRLIARQPRLRLVLALLTAEAVVVGALDLLFVILAVTVLGRPQAWAGYLNSAYGVGAVLAAAVGVLLVGRRLSGPILGAALLLSGALAALAAGLDPAGTVLLLTVAGTSRALLDVASRSLLQRSVPADCVGRVFGLLEGLSMAGLAVGAVLVPVLVHLGGSRLALLGVATVLPLAAAAGGRALLTLDSEPVPIVQIALLRSLPTFADLPAPALERLASSLVAVEIPAGTVLTDEGEVSDAYYAIAAGQFDVFTGGRFVRRCGRGEDVPRGASVIARTDATVYKLAPLRVPGVNGRDEVPGGDVEAGDDEHPRGGRAERHGGVGVGELLIAFEQGGHPGHDGPAARARRIASGTPPVHGSPWPGSSSPALIPSRLASDASARGVSAFSPDGMICGPLRPV